MGQNKKERKINAGENIKTWRTLKGIKEKDLANMINVSETTMSNIETGKKSPTIDECENIADVFGISFFDLLHHPSINISIQESPQSVGYINGTQNIQSRDNDILNFLSGELAKKDTMMKEFIIDVLNKITKN